MKFHQIRNATAIVEFAGKRFLIDPVLAPKEAYPGFEGTVNSHLFWPTVELPLSVDEILTNIDAVIVTHAHPDHWDEYAVKSIAKQQLILVQNAQEKALFEQQGFTEVHVLGELEVGEGIQVIKTSGQHGSDETMAMIGHVLGEVSGVVFKHQDEPTVYLAGDTVWNQYVEAAIEEHSPQVAILNAGDAQALGLGSIIMGKHDVLKMHNALPQAKIIATHMEAVNHATLSRAELNAFIAEHGLTDVALVPEDGECVEVQTSAIA